MAQRYRTNIGRTRTREEGTDVAVEPIRDVPAMATVDRQGRRRLAGWGRSAWLALTFRRAD